MPQGRQALFDVLENRVSWPPVVVPFGLDPWGWHGEQESYREVCDYAREHCTLLPKVFPFSDQIFVGEGDIHLVTTTTREKDGTVIRRYELAGASRSLCMEEIQTPGDSSWKNSHRWIANDQDLECFLELTDLAPATPDIQAVREKERQVGGLGLPFAEVADPFGTVGEMFSTEEFYVKVRTDTERIVRLLDITGKRIIAGIEALCRDAGCPFILRLVGAELAVPPFLSRNDFLLFEGDFYRTVADIAHRYRIPSAFHCHGPVRDIMDDIWKMGYNFIEPFEPEPRGNVTIREALECAQSRGVVFGGVDDVILNTGTQTDVRNAVTRCLDGARGTGLPYIISQSATPFHDPLSPETSRNIRLFMELGARG